jgi:uncharacterized protein (TIGR03067 family)
MKHANRALGLVLLTFAGAALLAGLGPAGVGKEAEKARVITAEELTKVYATDPAAFDKEYKGKALVVEGVVEDAFARDVLAKKTWVMLRGYTKPGAPVPYSVRCPRGPGLEYLRIGYKVRIEGTCQGYKDTRYAAELQDPKVVKVLADDYPPPKAVRDELKKLEGKWKVIVAQAGGQKVTGKDIRIETFDIDGEQIAVRSGNRVAIWGLVIDPTKEPKTMDFVALDGRKIPLVYALDGDQFRFALPPASKEGPRRPEGLDPSKALVVTAKRQ